MKDIDIVAISMYFIRLGNIVDITVVISSYFYLQNLECRFQTLNNFWTQLPDGFTTVPVIVGGWSNPEIVMMLDNVRRLHSELSDLLRIFSISFGQILLAFFVFSYIDIIFKFFISIHFIGLTNWTVSVNAVLVKLITFLVYLQDSIFVMSIIIAASRVKDTVNMTDIIDDTCLHSI
ncbi:unnamed protein product [Macrosiphum euphorbiae]|uniref:Gustatory receptor n=1 Tax=Macrosiphum euphorbiae TaxID=13131 RepID=A0AAV0W0Y6_9HEMI|nr:unnamed protein product [Macrosiphum euphorbiae]